MPTSVSIWETELFCYLDLVEEGFDLALRAGELADSTLIARHLMDGKKPKTLLVQGNVRANSGEIVRTLAVAGLGVALLPRFIVLKDLHEGRLIVCCSRV